MQTLAETVSGAERQVERPASQMAQDLRFLVFKLGDDEFALPIDAVDEVARVPNRSPACRRRRIPRGGHQSAWRGAAGRRSTAPVRHADTGTTTPDGGWSWCAPTASRRPDRRQRHRGAALPGRRDRARAGSHRRGVGLVIGVINLEEAGRMMLLLDPSELLSRAERGLLDTSARLPAQGARRPRS